MTRLPRVLAVLPALAVMALAPACAGAKLPLPDGEVEPPVSVDRIRHRPAEFIGKRVRLAADIGELYGERVFTLKDDDPAFKEQLLVITTKLLPELLAEEWTLLKPGEKLLVSGTIRGGALAELEAELGVDLDPRLEARFRDKPVLVATEVVRTGDKEPTGTGSAVPRRLEPEQLRIESAPRHQLGVGAVLHQFSAPEHEDAVGHAHGREPV